MASLQARPTTPTPLHDAIDTISDKTLRALKSICDTIPEDAKASKELLVSSEDIRHPGYVRSLPNEKKRPVSQYAFCGNCEKEVDVTTNSATSCRFHPARSYPTGEELEVDFDEDDRLLDTEDWREEFPHCFTFSCCGGNLRDDPGGCKVGWHEEVSKRFQGPREAVCGEREEKDEEEDRTRTNIMNTKALN